MCSQHPTHYKDYTEIYKEIDHHEDSNTKRTNPSVGDQMSKKPANTTRIYAQNINGMDIDKSGGHLPGICIDIEQTQTDILLLTEPGICHHLNGSMNK